MYSLTSISYFYFLFNNCPLLLLVKSYFHSLKTAFCLFFLLIGLFFNWGEVIFVYLRMALLFLFNSFNKRKIIFFCLKNSLFFYFDFGIITYIWLVLVGILWHFKLVWPCFGYHVLDKSKSKYGLTTIQ